MADEDLTAEEATFRDEEIIAYPGSTMLRRHGSWVPGDPHGLDYHGVRADWHVWRRAPTTASRVQRWYGELLAANGWREVECEAERAEIGDVRVYRRDRESIAVIIRPQKPAVWAPQGAYDEPGTVFEVTLTERPRTRHRVFEDERQRDAPATAGSSKTDGVMQAWRLPLDGVDELAADEGLVVVASPWELCALNAGDGSIQWAVEGVESDGGVELQLTHGRVLYWASDGDHVFESSTGRALDAAPGRRPNAVARPRAVAVDARVQIVRIHNGIEAVGPDGGKQWSFDAHAAIVGGPVVGRHHAYVITQAALYAVDVNTGRLDWRLDATSQSYDACRRIVLADGRVCVGLADGTVCSLEDAAQPAGLARVQAWRPPVVDRAQPGGPNSSS